MATWNDLRLEIDEESARLEAAGEEPPPSGHDIVRRKYLAEYEEFAGHPLLVYASHFTEGIPAGLDAGKISLSPHDKDGWIEAVENLPDGPLDLMLHSPGGSPAVAEWVVQMLRQRFDPIRAIVPHSAKSAATMIALGCDEIMMDERGELGPIDPQMVLDRLSPAQAILDQFAQAKEALAADPTSMAAWAPILQRIGPSLLAESQNAIKASKQIVKNWLEAHMFRGTEDPKALADGVGEWLGNHNEFLMHERPVMIDELLEHDVQIVDLRKQEFSELRERSSSVWLCFQLTLDATTAYKIIENSRGEAFVQGIQRTARILNTRTGEFIDPAASGRGNGDVRRPAMPPNPRQTRRQRKPKRERGCGRRR